MPLNSNPTRFAPNQLPVKWLHLPIPWEVLFFKFMENLRYIDKLGRGLPMVCYETEKLGREVSFAEVGEEFQVILPL